MKMKKWKPHEECSVQSRLLVRMWEMPSNILRRKCGCIFYTLLDCRWVRNNRNEIGSLPCLRLVRVGFCRRHGAFFSSTERTLLFLSRTACFLRFLGFNHPKNIGNILRSRWLHLRHSWLLCSTLSGPCLIGGGGGGSSIRCLWLKIEEWKEMKRKKNEKWKVENTTLRC